MDELWKKIIAWFTTNVPPHRFCPAPGVAPEELTGAESTLGVRLPDDLRESYLLHNGLTCGAFWENYTLMPLAQILRARRLAEDVLEAVSLGHMPNYDEMAMPRGPIKKVLWNREWIPIMETAAGDHISVDLDPAAGGSRGQLIEISHEEGPLWVLGTSFRHWLAQYVHDLEAGKYRFNPDSLNIEKGKGGEG